jgi:putative GTP pyrophosphokinase
MANPEDKERARVSIERVLAEFDGKKELLTAFGEKTKSLIEEFLQDAKVRFQSVQVRVKGRDKLKEKYVDPKKNYTRLDDVTDQVALRVITYYEDEVDHVAEVIKREFDVDPQRSVDKRETEPDKFGYYSLNFVCKYSDGRVSHTEYKKFAGVWCEIQIVSILRHAWSEIEHPWYDLKGDFPDNIKRRFARIAALLEIAESEFLSLRKLQSDYQRSVAVQVEAKVPDLAVDAVSIRSFIDQEPLVAKVDELVARALGARILQEISDRAIEVRSTAARHAGMTKLQDVLTSLKDLASAVPVFVGRCRSEVWQYRPAPSTLPKGVSIYQVSMLLEASRGVEATTAFFKAIGSAQPPAEVEAVVRIAKDVIGSRR